MSHSLKVLYTSRISNRVVTTSSPGRFSMALGAGPAPKAMEKRPGDEVGVVNLVFSRGRGEGCLFEGGRLFQILSLRRGANSKRGAYLKLSANSSIYSTQKTNQKS